MTTDDNYTADLNNSELFFLNLGNLQNSLWWTGTELTRFNTTFLTLLLKVYKIHIYDFYILCPMLFLNLGYKHWKFSAYLIANTSK